MSHQIRFSLTVLQWSTSRISSHYPIITLFVCQLPPMHMSFWKALLWEAPLIDTERSKQDAEPQNDGEHLLIRFARLTCVRTYGSVQKTARFSRLRSSYLLLAVTSCVLIGRSLEYPFELVIRHSLVTVEKSSSHSKSISCNRMINN